MSLRDTEHSKSTGKLSPRPSTLMSDYLTGRLTRLHFINALYGAGLDGQAVAYYCKCTKRSARNGK
jgi:hypothetical protein